MKKMIMLPCLVMSALMLSCSSSDDKTLNNESENVTTEKSSQNSVNLTVSASTTKTVEFCIFGDFCDENGRHAEAIQYEVSAWTYSGDPEDPRGTMLYEKELSPLLITDYEDGSFDQTAEPLCLILPDTAEEDQYYLEIYYGGLIRSGVITESQVKDLFDGDDRIDYYQFREGNCNLGDSPELF